MLIEVKVPQLAEGTPEGTLAAWHVKAGDAVKRDQNLCDIETDKVVLETPAQGDGVLVEIKVQAGATVTSGVVLGVIDTEAKAGLQPRRPLLRHLLLCQWPQHRQRLLYRVLCLLRRR